MVEYINKNQIKELLPKRIQNSNKSTYGRILNIAGSKNYIGASYLSSISALKSGAGYVCLACSDDVRTIVASLCPEITFMSRDDVINSVKVFDVISLGCGLGVDENVKEYINNILKIIPDDKKIVIDADAINILALLNTDISLNKAIITPHPKELSRLLKVDVNTINSNREKYARIASKRFNCITLLKGHNTVITDGNRVCINNTGNSSLAKAGTGDVLTGIISAMLAQGLSLFDAGITGVYIHGSAGDLASDKLSQYCVLASDVINYIPSAFNKIINED